MVGVPPVYLLRRLQGPTTRSHLRHLLLGRHGRLRASPAPSAPPLTPSPSSSDWVIDSGASSHITANPGMVTVSPCSSFPSSIVVGNGATLPVIGTGYAVLPGPFCLDNVLVALDIIKNLLFAVEFDSLGVSVKDLRTQNTLLRCNSTGPLYTLQLPSSTTGSCALVATPSPTTWHRRLGHPRQGSTLAPRSVILDCLQQI